jgi:hypothetical protein
LLVAILVIVGVVLVVAARRRRGARQLEHGAVALRPTVLRWNECPLLEIGRPAPTGRSPPLQARAPRCRSTRPVAAPVLSLTHGLERSTKGLPR